MYILGKGDEELGKEEDQDSDDEDNDDIKPFNMSALKTRAYVVAQRERREAALGSTGNDVIGPGSGANVTGKKSKSKK